MKKFILLSYEFSEYENILEDNNINKYLITYDYFEVDFVKEKDIPFYYAEDLLIIENREITKEDKIKYKDKNLRHWKVEKNRELFSSINIKSN